MEWYWKAIDADLQSKHKGRKVGPDISEFRCKGNLARPPESP